MASIPSRPALPPALAASGLFVLVSGAAALSFDPSGAAVRKGLGVMPGSTEKEIEAADLDDPIRSLEARRGQRG